MTIFIDTSALYALLDADDLHHSQAKRTWTQCIEQSDRFSCSNYILLESMALIQQRLGMTAARLFQLEMVPLFHVHWINTDLHGSAVSALLATNQRNLSLVDCTSFELMRRFGIRSVFAFDNHFMEQGFVCLPEVYQE